MPTYTSIIDNRDDNTLLANLQRITDGGKELCIASAFFSLDAFLMLADTLGSFQRVRLLFGDDANATQRKKLIDRLNTVSDLDLLAQRDSGTSLLSPLKVVEQLFVEGRIEARCYTRQKFHAKAYLTNRESPFPPKQGVLGSGNFTRSGLTRNIELNVHLTVDQTVQLETWFDERWAEASQDVVTLDLLKLLRRQIELYDPYVIYQNALTLWGGYTRGDLNVEGSDIVRLLDPHQDQGFRQALRVIERENGVMVCDGVGLGKSFIGLALMEHYCRDGRNVLLIAPKNILDSSWHGYLDDYLAKYRSPFGNIHEMSMTDFGFDSEDDENDKEPASNWTQAKRRLRDDLMERADVIVIDEAHNFRTTASSRYQNLYKVIRETRGRRKKVILLTATPINTAYTDLSAEVALITHDKGSIGGYQIAQIRKAASTLDREMANARRNGVPVLPGQLSLELQQPHNVTLDRVLESIVIQRSRSTCRALAEAVGKPLFFPLRNDPICHDYKITNDSAAYRELINTTHRLFEPGAALIKSLREEIKNAGAQNRIPSPTKRRKLPGIKLAAFLTEQYRHGEATGRKRYEDEVRLAGLVFANTLKQLESSPVAFQGIIQSLGAGLIARLEFVGKAEARQAIEPHLGWVRTPLFPDEAASIEIDTESEEDIVSDGEVIDVSGAEVDEWLEHSVKQRGLAKKLKDFTSETFDVERWQSDIQYDLLFLSQIHEATLRARAQVDPKLSMVKGLLAEQLKLGRRVLVFTQSQRTAQYLEAELTSAFPQYGIARIDSRVEKTRAAILHAFAPNYNPPTRNRPPSVPERVDILVSTDVLAEGVNLQEAGAIFNYDIHWNPVRLIQRIGRVDRRLDPTKTPEAHEFDIFNILPPPEINDILGLVGVIEGRTIQISRALGLDAAFFRSGDPANTLREFNSRYEGQMTGVDRAITEFLRRIAEPDPALEAALEQLPAGAFGVWKSAPCDGLFAVFTLESEGASEADCMRFASEIGRPILALDRPGMALLLHAGDIFDILSGTVSGVHSGSPSDERSLSDRLKRLKNAVRQQYADIELPVTIKPRLVCWMELKKGQQ